MDEVVIHICDSNFLLMLPMDLGIEFIKPY